MRWALRLTFWVGAVLMGEGADLTVALEAWGLGGSARGSGLVVVLAAWGLLGVRQSWLRLTQSGG